jgi:hypothetical protein
MSYEGSKAFPCFCFLTLLCICFKDQACYVKAACSLFLDLFAHRHDILQPQGTGEACVAQTATLHTRMSHFDRDPLVVLHSLCVLNCPNTANPSITLVFQQLFACIYAPMWSGQRKWLPLYEQAASIQAKSLHSLFFHPHPSLPIFILCSAKPPAFTNISFLAFSSRVACSPTCFQGVCTHRIISGVHNILIYHLAAWNFIISQCESSNSTNPSTVHKASFSSSHCAYVDSL